MSAQLFDNKLMQTETTVVNCATGQIKLEMFRNIRNVCIFYHCSYQELNLEDPKPLVSVRTPSPYHKTILFAPFPPVWFREVFVNVGSADVCNGQSVITRLRCSPLSDSLGKSSLVQWSSCRSTPAGSVSRVAGADSDRVSRHVPNFPIL